MPWVGGAGPGGCAALPRVLVEELFSSIDIFGCDPCRRANDKPTYRDTADCKPAPFAIEEMLEVPEAHEKHTAEERGEEPAEPLAREE